MVLRTLRTVTHQSNNTVAELYREGGRAGEVKGRGGLDHVSREEKHILRFTLKLKHVFNYILFNPLLALASALKDLFTTNRYI